MAAPALLLAGIALLPGMSAGRLPAVADVPSRPAFTRPPGAGERAATVGQVLPDRTLLRTQRPGRMQVDLPDGRSFRLGGDAVVRLTPGALDLQRGQLIAWVTPGRRSAEPLRVRTRAGTASIEGTTVFLEVDDAAVLVFSWEGTVRFTPASASGATALPVLLRSGEQLTYRDGQGPALPRRLSRQEALQRRRRSVLLNGFAAPMATLPVLERELNRLPGDGP